MEVIKSHTYTREEAALILGRSVETLIRWQWKKTFVPAYRKPIVRYSGEQLAKIGASVAVVDDRETHSQRLKRAERARQSLLSS